MISGIEARLLRFLLEAEEQEEKLRSGHYQQKRVRGVDHVWKIPKSSRPKCGARTRNGEPCKAPAVLGMSRCRMHGGLSTGPKTAEGRERIAESNRRRVGFGR